MCNACFVGFKSKELLENHTEEFHSQTSKQRKVKQIDKHKAVARSRKTNVKAFNKSTKRQILGVQKSVREQAVAEKEVPVTTSERASIVKEVTTVINTLKTIPCSVCLTAFACRTDLIDHIEEMHPLIKCLVCPLSFRSIEKVKSHMKNIHQQEYLTEKNAVSVCQQDRMEENVISIVETESENRENHHKTYESSFDLPELETDIIEIDEKFIVEDEMSNRSEVDLHDEVEPRGRIRHEVYVIEECEMIAVDECELNENPS